MNFSSPNQQMAKTSRVSGHRFKTPVSRLLTAFLCLPLVWFSASAQNTATTRTNQLSPDRYLLIVETSPGMKARAANLQQTLGKLFSSGLNGQLRPGDTVGVWTYNDALSTGKFPLKRWTPQSGRDITIALLQFLQQQNYDRPSSLAPVLAQLTNVVANSEKITVLIVSAGSEAPVGTPFDTPIAEAYKHNAAEQQEQSMPFVTVLRAVRGEFIGFRVNTPPWPVEFPLFPTNLPPAVVLPPKETAPAPLRVSPAVVPEPAPVPAVATNVSVPPTNPPVTNVATAAPPATQTNQPLTAIPPPRPVASNVVRAPMEKTNTVTTAVPATVAIPAAVERKLPFIPILVGVVVAIVGLVILCFALLKRSREAPRVSLITRSMNKDDK